MNIFITKRQRYIWCLFILAGLFITGCRMPYAPQFLQGFDLNGYEQMDALVVYSKNNLFNYINGEAEVYLPLGFQFLFIQKYQDPEDGIQMVMEAYDMGSHSGAEGVFQKYTNRGDTKIQGLGEAAWTDDYIVLFWRGPFFFRITPDYSLSQEKNPELKDLLELGKAADAAMREKI